MVTGFKISTGADLDTIFAARVSAAGANTGFKNSAGVDLAQLFEPGQATIYPSNTGFRNSAGTDFRNLFSTTAGPTPQNFAPSGYFSRASGTTTVTITMKPDGSITATTNLGGSAGATTYYFSPVTAAGGDAFDVEFVKGGLTGSGGGGTAGGLAGGAGVWYQLNVDRAVSLTCSGSSGAPRTAGQSVACRVRRRSDLSIVCTGTIAMDVESGI